MILNDDRLIGRTNAVDKLSDLEREQIVNNNVDYIHVLSPLQSVWCNGDPDGVVYRVETDDAENLGFCVGPFCKPDQQQNWEMVVNRAVLMYGPTVEAIWDVGEIF